MQEDLLGYLLGALEPDEMLRVEQWLREDAGARRELIELERVLKRLEDADELDSDVVDEELADLIDLTPPVDLVARTLASLPPLPPREDLDEQIAEPSVRVHSHSTEGRIVGGLSLSSTQEGGLDDSWSLRDWGASIAAVVIVIAIVMPTLFEGRFAARKAACQNNLRELGLAMTQFAGRNAQSRLPAVAAEGYRAFAGIYFPQLGDVGLIDSPRQNLCPSIGTQGLGAEVWNPGSNQHHPIRTSQPEPQPPQVTLQELDEIGEVVLSHARNMTMGDPDARRRMTRVIERLRWIQMTAGGDYTYTLGVRDEGHFSSPRFEGRSRFAVMSDAAFTRVKVAPAATTRNAIYRFNVSSHGGRGINVLYEDGHVRFLPSESLDRIPDNPLINHDGLIEAGVTRDDSSLGQSWQPPFTHAIQR